MRVQIPAYTDMWMRGARYGHVNKTFTRKATGAEYARVTLDATNKDVVVLLGDCQIIDDDSTAFKAYAESVGRRALFDPES